MRNVIIFVVSAVTISLAYNMNPDPDGEPWIVSDRPIMPPTHWPRPDVTAIVQSIARSGNPLPSKVDHCFSPYMRPVFNQNGNSCTSAAAVGNVFGYEHNCYYRRDGKLPENQFPTFFTWLLSYQHTEIRDLMRFNGIPNVVDYGGDQYSKLFGYDGLDGWSATDYGWMTGFSRWRNAMNNRVQDTLAVNIKTPDDLLVLKKWLVDHWGDTSYAAGGVADNYLGIGPSKEQTIPAGQYGAGKKIMISAGASIDHATTIAGYDDSICWDYNGNGTIDENTGDMATWERGAVIMLNTWGTSYGNGGTIYIPYRVLKQINMWVCYFRIRKNYSPNRVMKISMNYSQRCNMKLEIGVSADTNTTTPSRTTICYHFNYDGRGAVPMLGKWIKNGAMHTESMEFGFDCSDSAFVAGFNTNNPLKYFLKISTNGSAANATGTVDSMSVIDFSGNTALSSVPSPQKNVSIKGANTVTYVSVVVKKSTQIAEAYCVRPVKSFEAGVKNGLIYAHLPYGTEGPLSAQLFDPAGRRVDIRCSGRLTDDHSTATFRMLSTLGGGVYLFRLQAGTKTYTKNLIVF